ncbi:MULTISPECIES: hypothetical protein [Streptomyces]|uniref:hypothetical protein n=1 Tax=Streptomyces TaxID=1883 RepID=UPI00068023A7|nr:MULTISPECIES: hypothetical protein [Streptomyces]WSU74987.1 hypothetical protein OG499_19500 [Streptomyces anulatus]WTD26668.1 hypothetical protein OH737_19955 [Streptomyces anulatus]
MLWHAIAPSRRYTKASHDVVRHPRLSSDAKVLILYVQGLPDGGTDLALSEHARKLDIKGRAYQRAKEQLLLCGFVHERRVVGERGRWVTQQVFSNVPLADAEVSPLWCDAGVGVGVGSGVAPSPSARFPTVGQPGPRTVGHQLPVDEEREKNYSRPPTEALSQVVDLELLTAEEVQAERVLLSLRHVSRGLHLGVAEARVLVGQAVEWLRRGVSVGELRRVLSSDLPEGGVRSAVGFLRHRLAEKMPEATVPAAREVQPMSMQEPEPEPSASDAAPPSAVPRYVPPLVTCPGPGPEHVFRAMAGETECPDCRQAAAWARWAEHRIADLGGDADGWQAQEQLSGWRGRLAAATAAAAARQELAGADMPVPGGEQVAAGHGIGNGIR